MICVFSALSSGNRINHTLDLTGVRDGKAGCLHQPLDPFAVGGMAVAALHQLKENVIVDPRADAADTGI